MCRLTKFFCSITITFNFTAFVKLALTYLKKDSSASKLKYNLISAVAQP